MDIVRPPQSAVSVAAGFEIFVPLAGLIDVEKELARLRKDVAGAGAELERCNQKLSNDGFVKRAPAAEVEKIRERLVRQIKKITRLNDSNTIT